MPFFRDVVGQDETKRLLLGCAHDGKMPHALLFAGKLGTGKLPLALALSRYLLCQHPDPEDACGKCPACKMMDRLAHPDLHFVFPIVKRKGGKDTVCDEYLSQWREMLERNAYVTLQQWMEKIDAGNQQPQIYVRESDEIQRKLSLKSSQGGYKVMLVWLPEKMNVECANKLLKLLEEPPAKTVFLLVSEQPEQLLATIVSRTQRINLHPLEDADIVRFLQERCGLVEEDAHDIAHRSAGSLIKALENIQLSDENKLCFELFVSLMRQAYSRDIRGLKSWSEQVAGMGRERQKNLLEYCQRMARENFVNNFHRREMVYMNAEEEHFAVRFSPFINERNIFQIMALLGEAQAHIEQNVNPKMVFFDMALKMIIEMKQR